jgi:hypothetical protein
MTTTAAPSSAEKRGRIAEALRAAPERSNRKIAADLGLSDKTVASVRDELAGSAEIPQFVARGGRGIKPAEFVVAITAFAFSDPDGSVQEGTRLRADDPVAVRFPQLFLRDGENTPAAIAQRLLELHPAQPSPTAAPTQVPRPVRLVADEDTVVCIRACAHGSDVAHVGSQVDKRSRLARENRGSFVPMNPRGVPRVRARVALAECKTYARDREGNIALQWHILPGQWADKDDPEAAARPHNFTELD